MADKITADEYKTYVDQMIPLTFALADIDAYMREFGVFIKLTSESQSVINVCVDVSGTLANLSTKLVKVQDISSEDIDSISQQLMLTNQILNCIDIINYHVSFYKVIRDGLNSQTDKSYNNYDIHNVYINTYQPKIDEIDGIYVEGGNWVMTVVTVFKSIWQVITNNTEEDQIKADAKRLEESRCGTSQYIAYAKAHTQELIKQFTSNYEVYDKLIDKVKQTISTVDEQDLKKRVSYLIQQLNQFGAIEIEKSHNRIIAKIRAVYGEQNDIDQRNIMIILSKQKLRLLKNSIQNSQCSEVHLLRSQLDILQTTIRLYELSNLDSDLNSLFTEYNNKLLSCASGSIIQSSKLPIKEYITSSRIKIKRNYFSRKRSNTSVSFKTELITANLSSQIATIDDSAGYCLKAVSNNYQVCGGSSFYNFNNNTPWEASRVFTAQSLSFPGQYNRQRAEYYGKELTKSLNAVQDSVKIYTATVNETKASRSTYVNDTLIPAEISTNNKYEQIASTIRDFLIPNITNVPTTPGPVQLPQPFYIEIASNFAKNLIQEFLSLSPYDPAFNGTLYSISGLINSNDGEVQSTDKNAFKEVLSNYLTNDGYIKPQLFKLEDQEIVRRLTSQTISNGSQTNALKSEINRATIGYVASSTVEQKNNFSQGLWFLYSADLAYSSQDNPDGDTLLKTAKEIIDFALGFIPVISSINDFTQIIFGLATGKDYSGNEMTTSSYLLRGLGIILGLLPLGGEIVKVGGKILNSSFVQGAKLVFKTSTQGIVNAINRIYKAKIVHVIESIGEAFDDAYVSSITPEQLSQKIGELLMFDKNLAENAPELYDMWLELRELGYGADDGAVGIFRDTTFSKVELPSDGIYARVVKNQYVDGIVNGTGNLSGGNEAFITAARDLDGLTTPEEIANRLTLREPNPDGSPNTIIRDLTGHTIVEFKISGNFGIQTPVNFDFPYLRDTFWQYGGQTLGGAREWIIKSDASLNHIIEVISTRPIGH